MENSHWYGYWEQNHGCIMQFVITDSQTSSSTRNVFAWFHIFLLDIMLHMMVIICNLSTYKKINTIPMCIFKYVPWMNRSRPNIQTKNKTRARNLIHSYMTYFPDGKEWKSKTVPISTDCHSLRVVYLFMHNYMPFKKDKTALAHKVAHDILVCQTE